MNVMKEIREFQAEKNGQNEMQKLKQEGGKQNGKSQADKRTL